MLRSYILFYVTYSNPISIIHNWTHYVYNHWDKGVRLENGGTRRGWNPSLAPSIKMNYAGFVIVEYI